ncbi:MAG: FGGY family carbohydrate kinase [Ancalomicrobiaceae bacterium]|nr:FGGY family carbohydrate kinase [Ancalomicrobiaceae bacterium]
MAVAIIDIGKTNIKVAAFAEGGRLIAETSQPNESRPGPPYRHLATRAIWRFVLDALEDLGRRHPIDCIVPTTHGATVALVGDDPDRDEGLVLPILDYEEPLVDSIEPDYAPIRPPFAATFSPPLGAGLNFGRQLAYLKKTHADNFARAKAVLAYPQYWSWRLSGAMTSEATSYGCHSDLWEPVNGRFSSLADALALRTLLPPLVGAQDQIGTLRPELAARTGLSPSTRVLSGIHDSNASLLPHLLGRMKPFTVISTGTWVIVMAAGIALDRLDAQADMLANVAADGQPVACARFMGGREFATLTEGLPQGAGVDDLAAILYTGTLALPAFSDEGGPFRHVPGRIVGSMPERQGAWGALANLYTALMTDHLLTRLGADRGPIIVEGGFVKSPAYAGVLAALRPNQPVEAATTTAGTAQGAALLASWPKPPANNCHAVAPLDLPGLKRYADRWRTAVARL